MKAAVMFSKGEIPQYVNFPEPTAQNSNEVLVSVKAVAIKHFDKARASGKHYSDNALAITGRIIGGDGVCLLDNGTRIYGVGVSGTLSEKAVINKNSIVAVPPELNDATAAALPNAVIGAAMALRFKAAIQPGDVVLINGATGFTGRVAVQIAKHYGAKKIIVTGRNPKSLNDLLGLGAQEVISINQADEKFTAQLKAIHAQTPIDIVIDYLWGHTAEMILDCLKGDGSFTNKICYVSVGSMGGDSTALSSEILRSADLQLSGSGLGSWPKYQLNLFFTEILPEMYQLAAKGQLTIEIKEVKLENIATLWDLNVPGGQRLVVTI